MSHISVTYITQTDKCEMTSLQWVTGRCLGTRVYGIFIDGYMEDNVIADSMSNTTYADYVYKV